MDLKQIEVKMSRAGTLPILPNIVIQVLRLTDDPNASARDYEKIITQDAGLMAKILRTANSPYYCGNGQITTLQRALSQLGVNAIRSICMTVAFQSAMLNKSLNKRFNVRMFWQHSLAVACSAKIFARLTHSPLSEEAFIAGLVHDIGKMALCLFLPLEANLVYNMIEAQQLSDYDAEMEILGLTHQDIGHMAAKLWGLPDIYLAPIAKHHTPTEDVYEIDPLTAFVHVGNAMAYEIELYMSPAGDKNSVDPMVFDFLGIPEAQYQPIRQTVLKEVVVVGQFFGM